MGMAEQHAKSRRSTRSPRQDSTRSPRQAALAPQGRSGGPAGHRTDVVEGQVALRGVTLCPGQDICRGLILGLDSKPAINDGLKIAPGLLDEGQMEGTDTAQEGRHVPGLGEPLWIGTRSKLRTLADGGGRCSPRKRPSIGEGPGKARQRR